MVRFLLFAVTLTALSTAVTGCSRADGNRAAISGRVTLDGTPIEEGSILFVPVEGAAGNVAGGPIKDGRYKLPPNAGAFVGRNRVEIRSPRTTGRTIQYAPGTAPSQEVIQMVARRFNAESTLKVEVQPGQNSADFAVGSK